MTWRRSIWKERKWRDGEGPFARGQFFPVFWGRDNLYMHNRYLEGWPRTRAFIRRFPELLYLGYRLHLIGIKAIPDREGEHYE